MVSLSLLPAPQTYFWQPFYFIPHISLHISWGDRCQLSKNSTRRVRLTERASRGTNAQSLNANIECRTNNHRWGTKPCHRSPSTVIELSTARFAEVLLDDAAILTVRFTVSQHLLTLAIWAIHRLGFKHCLDFSTHPLTVQCPKNRGQNFLLRNKNISIKEYNVNSLFFLFLTPLKS